MSNTTRVSRGLALTALLGFLAIGTASAENYIEKARSGYLPQPPAAVKTTTASEWTVDIDALAARYTYQPELVGTGAKATAASYLDAIEQARDGYVYTPAAKQADPSEQVARR